MMKEDLSLSLVITGHTDYEGDETLNIDLSKRRRIYFMEGLVRKFSCDASRLLTDSKGESEPVTKNSKSEGCAANRRLEQ